MSRAARARTTPNLAEFLLARIAEDESNETEQWPGEAQTQRATVLACRQKLAEAGPGASAYERALRHFATRYAQHPDYRPQWRP